MKNVLRFCGILSIIGISFSMAVGDISAGGTGLDTADYIYFRVDTELDVPAYYSTSGATIRWSCGTGLYGLVTDGTASDSDGAVNGVVQVASASAEMGDSESGCDVSDTLTGSASFSGWVTRNFTATAITNTANFTIRASMDYAITVTGVTNELGSTLTLNGTTASATYSTTVASQSYSGGKKYIAGTVSGGTVKGGANGYVNSTSSALTISATASTSTSFSLSYGVKATLNGTTRTGQAVSNITGATVTAGDNNTTSCTGSGGSYYCAVPLAHTGTTATASNVSNGMTQNLTCTYTDRTTGGDAQSTCIIQANEPTSGVTGGGGGGAISIPTTPVPEATTTPEASPTPSVIPEATPTPPVPTTSYPWDTPAPSPVPSAAFYRFTRDLFSGRRGVDVRALQQYLATAGFFQYAYGATGYFGPATKTSVAAWQKSHGLPAIGRFGPASRATYVKLMGH